jgi:type II secretory pathway component PulF
VRNATGNTYIRKLLDAIVLQVGEGAALSRALKKHEFFPSVLIDIVGVGEQTGKIAPALQRGAIKYDKEFSSQIQRLTILIQPITIMAVAIFVGVVAYSMITGILSTVNSIRMR